MPQALNGPVQQAAVASATSVTGPSPPPLAMDPNPSGPSGPQDLPDADSALRAERLRLFQADAPLAALGQGAASALLVGVLWAHLPPQRLLGWQAAVLAALALRLWVWWRHRRGVPASPSRRLREIRLSASGTGAVWGAAGVLLFLPASLSAQTFLVFVLAGMAAGSLTLTAFDLRTALAFALLALLPVGVMLLTAGTTASLGMGGMVLLFVAFLALVGARAQRNVREAVYARAAEATRAEAVLRSQRQLRELSTQLASKSEALEVTLDSMDQGILALGADGRTNVYNRRVVELVELPEAFLAGRPTMQEISAYQVEHGHYGKDQGLVVDATARDLLTRWIAGEQPRFPASYFRRTLSGAMLEVKTRYLPDGGLVRTFTDVTAYFEAQAQTRKLALVAAHTDDGVAITDAGQRIEWVNDGFARMTGYTTEQAAGQPMRELLQGPDTDAAQLDRLAGELEREGRSAGELLFCTRQRRPYWCAFETQAVRDESGRVSQYVTIARDVTARREAELALRVARDQAERASLAKSEFLSSMSHELRTPMNAILGFAQLLDIDPALQAAERQRGYVQQILRAGAHLLELIGDVLDLARVEAGKQLMDIEAVPLRPLIEDCLALMRPVAQECDVHLEDLDDFCHHACVAADRTRLKQVLLNLLSNAIKYNRRGGSVRVHCSADGDALRLAVSDSGPGIAPEQRERLFTAFERLGAETGPIEGAGIGLALSRRLVELMHGRIGIDSQVGHGSTFWLRLPRAEPVVPAAPAAHTAAPRPAAAGACTVLYIEDNPVNVMLMEAMLEREPGVRLVTAQLPELGLELARSECPDLILLDIQLPGLDGYEVLRRLRALPLTRETTVVAVTANAMPGDLERGRAAGFDAYLTKPLMLEALLALVRGALKT